MPSPRIVATVAAKRNMSRSVILHHFFDSTVETQADHFDWMLEPPLDSENLTVVPGRLITFRIPKLVHLSPPTVYRIDDHRAAYLDYEGPVSGNRGHVHRVMSGSVHWSPSVQDCLEFEMQTEWLHPEWAPWFRHNLGIRSALATNQKSPNSANFRIFVRLVQQSPNPSQLGIKYLLDVESIS